MYVRREVDDIVQRAYNRALLDIILPSLTNVLDTLESRIELSEDITRDINITLYTDREVISLMDIMRQTTTDITGWSIYEFNKSIQKYVLIVFCGNSRANLIITHIENNR